MRLVSSAISLFVSLIMKIFTWFGCNGILVLVLVIEIVCCVGYTVGTSGYDQKSSEYSLTGVESVAELEAGDPLLQQNDVDTLSDDDHYYHVRIKAFNKYCNPLGYLSLDAQTTEGDWIVCRHMTYYGEDLTDYEYGVSAVIPAATEGIFDYLIHMRETYFEKSNIVEISDFSEGTDEVLTVTLPRE